MILPINFGKVIIKTITEEYREGDLAVRTTVVTFFCISIFKYKKTSTNNKAVAIFTVAKQPTKVTGFQHEESN